MTGPRLGGAVPRAPPPPHAQQDQSQAVAKVRELSQARPQRGISVLPLTPLRVAAEWGRGRASADRQTRVLFTSI